MKSITNWKTAVLVLSVFAFTMILLPAFTAQGFAADAAKPAAQAAQAGAAGGAATTAGISAGTIAIIVIYASAALAVAISAVSGDGTTSSHHSAPE